jgi:predicted Zn-dependent protease
MTDRPQPAGSLATALTHAQKLLAKSPALAEEQAREILKAVPGHPIATLYLALARRAQNDDAGAFTILEPLARAHPNLSPVQYELGSVLAALGKSRGAVLAFSRAASLEPDNPAPWRALGDQYTLLGEGKAADHAYARQIKASVNDPQLLEAASALCDNRLAVGERLLRDFVKANPTDVAAIRMLAETGARLGAYDDAENLLARALELAPSFSAARHNYAGVLHRHMKSEAALAQVDILLKEDRANPNYRALRAAILVRIGEFQRAIESYEILLRDYPSQPKAWMGYGHALKTVGRQDEGIAAYRRSIELLPSLGESYWSLANLKTFRFSTEEIEAMQTQLANGETSEEDRYHLHFALGKALEDGAAYETSFEHYAKGNALRRSGIKYDADATREHVQRSKAVFTPEFFRAHEGAGCKARDPIFIVSLPRAGSTLIEQILSSHSAIEGTMELPDIFAIARSLSPRRKNTDPTNYPEVLKDIEPGRLEELGEEYLKRASIQRKLGRPFFIDKMPNNFMHLGLIRLILPNARIIDARRHPLACCFSNFKQHYARGQAFAYDQKEVGNFYRNYVELMAHFDTVLPGHVHRVFHETLVENPEGEVRKLLDYCGLPFEESCLRFYENDRAVRTASSEQVRRPISTEGLDQWRHYEAWLDLLKSALGSVLDAYPAVPDFAAESIAES